MSSVTKNKINSREAFAALEEAVAVLEIGTEALARSINENSEDCGDFTLVRAVWDGQAYLADACRQAPVANGHDELWARVRAMKARAEKVIILSKERHNRFKERETMARKARESSRNDHRASGPEAVLSIPQYLGKESRKKGGRSPRKAAKSLRDQQIRSRMEGSAATAAFRQK